MSERLKDKPLSRSTPFQVPSIYFWKCQVEISEGSSGNSRCGLLRVLLDCCSAAYKLERSQSVYLCSFNLILGFSSAFSVLGHFLRRLELGVATIAGEEPSVCQ